MTVRPRWDWSLVHRSRKQRRRHVAQTVARVLLWSAVLAAGSSSAFAQPAPPPAAPAPIVPLVIVRMAPAPTGGEPPAVDPASLAAAERRAAVARQRSDAYSRSAQRARAQGRLLEAADLLHSATAGNPDDMAAQRELGEIYVGLGRFLEAIPRLQQALQAADEPDEHSLWLLACALAGAGDERGARAVLAAAGMPPLRLDRELRSLRRLRDSRGPAVRFLDRPERP